MKYIISAVIVLLIFGLTNTAAAYEYGVEYDSTNGLGINYDSAQSFANRFNADGWTRQFMWGNSAAWETDFKDVTKGGQDNLYADAADIVFFEGHGSPGGLHFPTNHDDSEATYNDIRLGDLDNEWIAAHSCSVLADSNLGNWAYDVLGRNGGHMMLSHSTTVYATNAGDRFSQLLISGWKVKDAWFQQHIEKQPAGVTARVIATLSTTDDHIWGHGSVALDPVPSDTWYYWQVTK